MASVQHLPSTEDNPYNPFDEFDQWLAYDMQMHHNSLGIMARLARQSPGLTDEENSQEQEQAIDTMVSKLFSTDGEKLIHYIKVSKSN